MYLKQQWTNGAAGSTPVSASRLDHVETQYDEVAEDLTSGGGTVGAAFTVALNREKPAGEWVYRPAVRLGYSNTYESWPVVEATPAGTVVAAYATGAVQHYNGDVTRRVVVLRSTDKGETWGSEITVANSGTFDESVFGMGKDAAGNLLMWVRRVTSGQVFTHVLYRSTDDGLSWTLFSQPTFNPVPVLIGPIVTLANGTLIAPVHAEAESGAASRSWGFVKSTNGGSTWTQQTVASPASNTNWPVEVRLWVHPDGRILGLGRTQVNGGALYQLQSTDGGATWALSNTNITDQLFTPTAIVGTPDKLSIYYYHRIAGILRARHTTFDTVWNNPTAWPASDVAGYGSKIQLDGGYPSAVRLPDRDIVVYYSGPAYRAAVYAIEVSREQVGLAATQTGRRPGEDFQPLMSIHPQPGQVINGDTTFDVTNTAAQGGFYGSGLFPVLENWSTQGQLFWRIQALVTAPAGQTIEPFFAYNQPDGTQVAISAGTTTVSSGLTMIDSGWRAFPADFGGVNSGHLNNYMMLRVRVTAGTGKLHAASRLHVAVR